MQERIVDGSIWMGGWGCEDGDGSTGMGAWGWESWDGTVGMGAWGWEKSGIRECGWKHDEMSMGMAAC